MEGGGSYERGTSVCGEPGPKLTQVQGLLGYLTYKKTHPPRTLQGYLAHKKRF